MSEEKKKKKTSDILPLIAAGGIVLVFAIALVVHGMWPHYFGATVDDLEKVDLAQTPKAIAHDLPASTVRDKEVIVELRHTVIGYESAKFSWYESADQVSSMRLVAPHEHHEKGKKEGDDREQSRAGKLETYLPGVEHGTREWGLVRFEASESGDVSFRVKSILASSSHAPNPNFDKQVDAARQVLMAVAFDVPPKLSHKELADLLGAGYPLADVAKLDPTVDKRTGFRAIATQFPGAIQSSDDSMRIPVDHPMLRDMQFRWKTPWNGGVDRLAIEFHSLAAFADRRATFIACVETKTGGPGATRGSKSGFVFRADAGDAGIELDVTPTNFETTISHVDAKSIATMIQTIDACR